MGLNQWSLEIPAPIAPSHTSDRRVASLLPHAVFLTLITAVSFIRWRLLRDTPYPTGLDGGNWLAFGHAIFGTHIRSSSLVYPPVVPLLAVFAERLFGTYGGLQVLAFLAAAAPAIGMYILLYAWGLGWRAAVLASFLAASAATGEAMAWGGYPQLIGLGLLPVFVLALDHFLTSQRFVTALPPAAILLTSLATSELVGPFTAIVGLIYLIGRYSFLRVKHQGNSPRNVAYGAGVSALLALLVAPIYLALAPGVSATEHAKLAGTGSLLNAIDDIRATTLDLPSFWQVGLVLALLTPVTILTRSHRLAALTVAGVVPVLALLVWSGENRLAYFVPVAIVGGLAAWWLLAARTPVWSQWTVDAAVVTFLALDILVGTQYFASDRNYYTILTPSVVQGFTELQKHSRVNDVIAVSPTANDWELGWWIEGAVVRRSIYAGNPIWLTNADEKARNAIANRIFSPDATVADSVSVARDAGAAYLFVDKDWFGYADWNSKGRSLSSNAIVYENQSVLIISAGG